MKIGIGVLVFMSMSMLFANNLVITEGNVSIIINSKEYNLTKGDQLLLKAGSKICVKEGNGTVLINNQVQLSADTNNSCTQLENKTKFDVKALVQNPINEVVSLFENLKEKTSTSVSREGIYDIVRGTIEIYPQNKYIMVANRWAGHPIRLIVVDENNNTVRTLTKYENDYNRTMAFIISREDVQDAYRIYILNKFNKKFVDVQIEFKE